MEMIAIWFWIGMFIWLIFGFWSGRSAPGEPNNNWGWAGGLILQFALLALLGFKVFGSPLGG